MLTWKEFEKLIHRKDAKIFVTSDTHFGHSKMITCGNRDFTSVEEMDKHIISQWNKVVGPKDLVFILGDFAYKSKVSMGDYLKALNGYKCLVTGNHDKVSPSLLQFDYYFLSYAELKLKNRRCVLCHYPITQWNGAHKNTMHFYGHLHRSSRNADFIQNPNAVCVNVEFWDYKPVDIMSIPVKDFIKERDKEEVNE